MRLIDAEHLYNEVEKLKESPWFNENINGSRIIRREALNIVEDLCICKAPTVCDIEQYAKEHNLFICTTNIIEQIREEIWNAIGASSGEYNEGYNDGIYHAIDVIDKYTKGESK